tara:strand:+ start:1362 stop:1589 length:228 start_codon:yes stop_codon:yes gene_type:complete
MADYTIQPYPLPGDEDYNKGVDEGAADTSKDFDINRFEALLNRLEASKKRQQRQKSVEGRRDTFSKGLASMMGNF